MTAARRHPALVYAQIKTWTRLLVEAAGGLEAAATVTRVRPSALQTYYSPQHPEAFAPADVLADLQAFTGDPLVTRYLAKLCGFDLVPIEPRGDEVDPVDLVRTEAEFMALSARRLRHALDATKHGAPSDRDIAEHIDHWQHLIRFATEQHDRLIKLQASRRQAAEAARLRSIG